MRTWRRSPCPWHKFKLDASNCDANLVPELISASNYLVSEDLEGATEEERRNYFNALERSSADQRVAVIKGTHTGVLHPKLKGGGTGIIGTFNQTNNAVQVAYTDALAISENVTLEEAARLLQGGWGGDDTFHGADRYINLYRFVETVRQRWNLPVKVEWRSPRHGWTQTRSGSRCWATSVFRQKPLDLERAGIADGPTAPKHGMAAHH